MTASKQRIALVSEANSTRTALAAYLANAGFEVHECDELALPTAFTALIAIDAHEAADRVLADVRSWIKLTRSQRVVVVTSQPTAFKDLVAAHGERLYVLPAAAFGWELVDALRATAPTRPRGA